MSAGELETISRLQVPAVLIHFNNACFGWIKALQRVTETAKSREDFYSVHQTVKNDPNFSVDFNRHDMSKLAHVYGIRGIRVETPDELETAFATAFSLKEPVFIDVVVESIADRLPPVHSWLKKVGVDPEAIGYEATF
jgi:acetolactate synthase-1/2/3 large subunit